MKRALLLVALSACAHAGPPPPPPPLVSVPEGVDPVVELRARAAEAEARARVAESAGIPAWAVVILVVAGAALGGGAVVGFYELRHAAAPWGPVP